VSAARRIAQARQLPLAAVVPSCPHCGAARTRLELAMADDDEISGDRHRCDECGGHWWQLHLPLSPAPR
jgi:transposase-like protein